VFRWSKYQAKVELPVEDWTDYEHENVCKVSIRLYFSIHPHLRKGKQGLIRYSGYTG
jgi:hypothetical protein